jgi:DNA-binding MarR family transcriptional regulator
VPPRSSPRPPDESVASAVTSIRRLVRVLRLNAQRTQAITGVTAAQLFVLQQLKTDDSLSLNELAARTLTDRSSVADVVDRLQAQRLVARAADSSDRRRASVRITPKGRRILSRAPDAPTTGLVAALHALTPRERRALARSLLRLNHALGAGDEPATMLFATSREIARPRRKASPSSKR